MPETLRIAVLSDLHCRHVPNPDNMRVTNLYSNQPRKPVSRNPVSAILELIKKDSLEVDLVVCPGDVADKADDQGLITGWGFLEEITTAFKAKKLIATVGNHDVRSRTNNPFEFLREFKSYECYPSPNSNLHDEFWSSHFAIIKENNYVVLVFNSAYSHFNETNAKLSMISQATIDKIGMRLNELDINNIPFKLLLCHHHPGKHSNMTYSDNDSIERGDIFLQMLNSQGFQLVIHGHKHDPRLSYMNGLPVIGSGSFSSLLNLTETGAGNCFHIIELNENEKKGTILTWHFNPNSGWQQKLDSYFPSFTGFGNTEDVKSIANECYEWFKKLGKNIIYYEELLIKFPDLKYLDPAKQSEFGRALETTLNLQLSPPFPNKPQFLHYKNTSI